MKSLPSSRFVARCTAVALVIGLAAQISAAPLLTVGSGGTHPSIQGAINACPSDGCTIQLLDSVYNLPRELWIENKRNLAIERSHAHRDAGIRPRLTIAPVSPFDVAGTAANPSDPQRPAGWKRWPVTCKDSVGGSLDSKNPYSTTGYQYNGLVVVLSSQDIRLEGLTLDGGAPTFFVNKGIWNCMYDVLFGAVGINLFHSARVVVRDSDLRNFFSAIYIRNRNLGGAVPSPHPDDSSARAVAPYSRYGEMGDHLIERNDIHNNWWAVYDEMEWDLGSTFRFNRIALNRNTMYATSTGMTSEGNNMAGGFLFVKDVTQAIHRIHNNTIWGSPLVIGHGSYKSGVQHLFYNNIVGGFEKVLTDPKLGIMLKDYRQILAIYGDWLDHNLFEIRDTSALVQSQTLNSIGPVNDSAVCVANNALPPCFLHLDTPTSFKTVSNWPWPSWKVAGGGIVRGKVGGVTVEVVNNLASELFPGGGRIQSFTPRNVAMDVSAADNLWAFAIPWKSTVQGAPGFLEPDWNDSLVIHTARGNAAPASGWTTPMGLPDRGAILSTSTYPEIWALHSQEPVLKTGANCYKILLRTTAGASSSPARIAKVEAWSAPFQDVNSTMNGQVKALKVRPLSDSSFQENQAQTFCLDSTPSPTVGLRFHVGLSRATASGTAYSEPAYYLLANPAADLTVGASRARRSALELRASWVRGGLVLRGLGDGPAKVMVRTLDGRTVFQSNSVARDGRLSVPYGTSTTGTAIVVVEQDGLRASARAVRVGIR